MTDSFRKVAHASNECLAVAAGVQLWHTLKIISSLELGAAAASHEFSGHSPRVSDKEMTDEKKKFCFSWLNYRVCVNLENEEYTWRCESAVTSPWLCSNCQRHFRIQNLGKAQTAVPLESREVFIPGRECAFRESLRECHGLDSVITAMQIVQTPCCS